MSIRRTGIISVIDFKQHQTYKQKTLNIARDL